MPRRKKDIFDRVADLDFGPVALCADRLALYERLNATIPALCRGLPSSLNAEGLLFMMSYCGLPLGAPLEFFHAYYPPCWTLLHWISGGKNDDALEYAVRAHAMAMLLHSFDDHLNDGLIKPTHLNLLIRSQAWVVLRDAIGALTHDRTEIDDILDEYYRAITDSKVHDRVDTYLSEFMSQMATGLIAPMLLARHRDISPRSLDGLLWAYRHFGAAWRVLDDMHDMEIDCDAEVHGAVYLLMHDKARLVWNAGTNRTRKAVTEAIVSSGAFAASIEEVLDRLSRGTRAAMDAGYPGYAAELEELASPVREFKP